MNKITISKAMDGYLLAAQARKLSLNTIPDYKVAFLKFLAFPDQEVPLGSIPTKLSSLLDQEPCVA